MRVEPPQTPAWHRAKNLRNNCGPYQIKAVLASHGIEKEIEDLYISELHRKADWTLPWDAKILLARHGIRSKLRFFTRRSLALRIIDALERNHPVVLVIRSTKSGNLHWISIWGYEERDDSFLVYDSQYEAKEGRAGNTSYARTILLDALPWRGTFAIEAIGP